MIRIRFATADDQRRLTEFLRSHWSATHVFVERPELFVWQHLQEDHRLNMVFGEDGAGEVLGVLGFIPMGRFDPGLGDRDVTLAIWKVRETGVPPGLGLRLFRFLAAELRPRMVAAIGISSMVRPIYRALGFQVRALDHAAVFHPERARELRVASGAPPSAFEPAAAPAGLELVRVDEGTLGMPAAIAAVCADAGPPGKSWRYLVERFLRHPWYRYELRAVRRHGEVVAVVVWRAVEVVGARVLRIVDIVGDTAWMRQSQALWQTEVVAADAEYIDLVCWGVTDEELAGGGFVSPSTNPDLVLPNYFSPFERRNVTIEAAVTTSDRDGHVRLYRADSDQDRPNLVGDLTAVPR